MTFVPTHLAYYRNIHQVSVVNSICFRFKDKNIIYGIRCRANDMIYIGSTMNVITRIKQHLLILDHTSKPLQADVTKLGLQWFTFYVFEVVSFPNHLNYSQRQVYLHKVEQQYMDMIPKSKLYNVYRSSS